MVVADDQLARRCEGRSVVPRSVERPSSPTAYAPPRDLPMGRARRGSQQDLTTTPGGHDIVTDSALRELADDPSSRKRFFKMMGGAGAVSAFSVFLAACGDDDKGSASTATTTTKDGTKGDLHVLNY